MDTNRITANMLFSATKSFVVIRALAGIITTVVMLIVGGIGVAICIALLSNENIMAALITGIIFFGGIFALIRLANRWILYMIKAAHIAAITEYIKTGNAPIIENGYKGTLEYGKDVVVNNFGAANIAFVADALIRGAVKQIMKWINKISDWLSRIPVLGVIISLLNLILSTALNFIDEAVLSYIFYHQEDKNAFKKACDGLSYYAQGWKGIFKAALKTALFIWAVRAVVLILLYMIVVATSSFGAGGIIIALLIGIVVLFGLESVIIDPYSTCIMINDYHKTIAANPELKRDLHGTLCKVSRKFRKLSEKSGITDTQI